jgi:hypothetical protein
MLRFQQIQDPRPVPLDPVEEVRTQCKSRHHFGGRQAGDKQMVKNGWLTVNDVSYHTLFDGNSLLISFWRIPGEDAGKQKGQILNFRIAGYQFSFERNGVIHESPRGCTILGLSFISDYMRHSGTDSESGQAEDF